MTSLEFASVDEFSQALDKEITGLITFLEEFPEAENLIISLQYINKLVGRKDIIDACRALKSVTRGGRYDAFDLRIMRDGEYLIDVLDKIKTTRSELSSLAIYPQLLNSNITHDRP